MKNKNKLWWYLGVVFILSYGWQYLIYLTGGIESKLFPFLMLFPGIVAVFFIILSKTGFLKIGWGLKNWGYILPAIFIPLVVSLGLVLIIEGLNWGSLSEKLFVFNNGMLESTKIGLLLGNDKQTITFFIVNLTLSHIVFLIGGSILTLGEELGWRGYLQEKLLRKYGLIWGFIFLGAIWGYWHLPIILMGYNFPSQPVLGALILMPVGTIFIGTFLGWIYLRSKSIWMPALAHASLNLFSGFLYGMTMNINELSRQLVWIAAWGIVATFCLIDIYKTKPILWQEIETKADNNVNKK
ncbi:MAG: CPBP family intramembrane metalloprotease [Bacteroidetes bacterium]|nr:CPBP family intramembrane metalloprotease [Bacteroidota bacterium]